MTKEQAAQALVQNFTQQANTQRAIKQQEAQLANLKAAEAKATEDFVAANGGEGTCIYAGHIITVAGGKVTVTPPSQTIININTK